MIARAGRMLASKMFNAEVIGLILVAAALQALSYGISASLRNTNTQYFFWICLVAASISFGVSKSKLKGYQASAGIAALGLHRHLDPRCKTRHSPAQPGERCPGRHIEICCRFLFASHPGDQKSYCHCHTHCRHKWHLRYMDCDRGDIVCAGRALAILVDRFY